jgi:hypothetical protein
VRNLPTWVRNGHFTFCWKAGGNFTFHISNENVALLRTHFYSEVLQISHVAVLSSRHYQALIFESSNAPLLLLKVFSEENYDDATWGGFEDNGRS